MKQFVLSSENMKRLLNSATVSNFLLMYFEISSQTRKLNYAHVSRKAGFASRSFLREVVLGKKRLSPTSIGPLADALGLSNDLRDYFFHLAAESNESIRRAHRIKPGGIEKLKQKLLNKNYVSHFHDETLAEKIYRLPAVSQVFAGLGNDSGSDLNEISERIQMPKNLVQNTLKGLCELNLIRLQENGKYVAETEHLQFSELGKSEVFKNLFLENLTRLKKSSENSFESAENLYFLSSFSVDKNKMTELKTILRERIHQFVMDNEKPSGDRVVNVVLGFF